MPSSNPGRLARCFLKGLPTTAGDTSGGKEAPFAAAGMSFDADAGGDQVVQDAVDDGGAAAQEDGQGGLHSTLRE